MMRRVLLPAGYTYTDPSSVSAPEFASLWNPQEIGIETEADYLEERNESIRQAGLSVLDVGVRDEIGRLVGFGSVTYGATSGELCDFAVRSEHRSRGIGRAILTERLRAAWELGIDSFCIPSMYSSNTLRSFYLEQGFTETAAKWLIRGPRPVRFSVPDIERSELVSDRLAISIL